MMQLNLQPTINQSFTSNIGQYRYDFTFKQIDDNTVIYDLYINEQPIQIGQRVTQGVMLMPYRYQAVDGNFTLYIPDGESPNFKQFGQSQFLYYLTPGEADDFGY